ncbi:exodeoxyribonuclease V subunit beta [Candidatus Electronema sp. PJ]|uniref:exodeoxyribonuclease V subunit beta n=1 Tax=Candidatus Electronema sp. PJ TaxID=3401572 RepID=UPI003AA930DA
MRPLHPLALPLHGQILIEASAGTGKTYTIALLFLRLLLEQELAVDEILVVTFTKAAVEELRGRIRQRIRDALDVLEGHGPEDQLLHGLLQQAGERDKAAVLLADALTRMDESAIYTIHSFCHRMLQEFAFESGAPFEMELIDSEAQLRQRIIEDFWRQRFYPALADEAAWALALWQSPQGLLNALGGHLDREDVECIPSVNQEELANLAAKLAALFTKVQQQWQREEIFALLWKNKQLPQDKRKGHGPERLAKAADLLDKLTSLADPLHLAGEDLELLQVFTPSGILSSFSLLKKNSGEPPAHPFFVLFEDFLETRQGLMRGRQIAVLLEARAYLRSELARRKQEQNQLCFDDLQSCLAKGLQAEAGDKLAQRIARRFPVILVDEFQDTDPLQYRIVKAVHTAAQTTQAKLAGLFLIGDPKQAIYSFRGADIFTYIQARHDTPERNRLTMLVNHRSSTAMVQAVSRLFSHEAPFLFAKEEIDFPPVAATGKVESQPLFLPGNSSALTCLFLEETGKALAKATAESQAARFCANEIAQLLAAGQVGLAKIGEQALAAGDIAVLVRTNAEAELIRRELNDLGITSVCGDRDSVFASKEARQLLRCMASLNDLSDLAQMRTVLAEYLFCWTAPQLAQLREDGQAQEEIMATMSRYQQLWQQQGFLPMFQQLLSEQKTVRKLLAAPAGERILTNFLHLAELLQEASRQQPGTAALLRWFHDQLQQPEGQAENQQLRLESDAHLVKIVTIHKAKGMEYPLVFLPFLWSARPCPPDKPLAFHRADRFFLDLGSGNQEHLALAEHERLAEDLRLLYVALTRAVHACYFCWGWIKGMEQTALAYLLHRGEITSAAQLLTDVQQLGAIKPYPAEFSPPQLRFGEQGADLKVARFHGKISTDWQMVSYSSLTARKDALPEQPDHDEITEEKSLTAGQDDVFGFPKGAAAGTCLHVILEQISFSEASGQEAMIRSQLERAGFAASWLPVVSKWIQDVVHTTLLPGFSLSKLKESERVNEMSFYFPLESLRLDQFNRVLRQFGFAPLPDQSGTLHGLMTGFIDLFFCWQGKYYLADYKSNYLGNQAADYSPEQLAVAMQAHRYDLQYLIYTVALHRFLARRIQEYSYEQHFGGVFYLFLRGMQAKQELGCGVFRARPLLALIDGLDRCCGGNKVG